MLADSKEQPLTQKEVQVIVRREASRQRETRGAYPATHLLFPSGNAGAPARAVQELGGHQDLMTTQRYMHLSPAALDAAIRLLEAGAAPATRGAHGEAAGTADKDARILEQIREEMVEAAESFCPNPQIPE